MNHINNDSEINVPPASALTPAGRADMHRDTCPSASSYHAQRISGRILLLSGGPSPLEGREAEPQGSRPRHVSPLGAICHLNKSLRRQRRRRKHERCKGICVGQRFCLGSVTKSLNTNSKSTFKAPNGAVW